MRIVDTFVAICRSCGSDNLMRKRDESIITQEIIARNSTCYWCGSRYGFRLPDVQAMQVEY